MKSLALCLLLPAFALFAQGQPNPPEPPNPPQTADAPNPPQPPQGFRPGGPMRGRMMPGGGMQGTPMQEAMRGPGMGAGGPMQRRAMGPMGQPQPPDYRALKEYLGLSDAQVRHMQQAGEKARRGADEKEKTLRPQIEQKRMALEDLLDGANPDAVAVGRAMIEIRGLEKQIREAREAVRTAELNVLTPEQRTKFKAVQDAANLPEAARQARQLGLVGPPPRPAVPGAPAAPRAPQTPQPPRK